jgi:hypothetical protein
MTTTVPPATTEMERIQRECASMAASLVILDEEEKRLRIANTILARRAVVMGCTAGLDGGTRRGARRKAAAKKIAESSSASSSSSSSSSTPEGITGECSVAPPPPREMDAP